MHADELVPGFVQASVVRLLLSLHALSELQVMDEEAKLRHSLLQPPALLQVSVVEELLSLQSLLKVHAMLQLPVAFTRNNAEFFESLTVYVFPFDEL